MTPRLTPAQRRALLKFAANETNGYRNLIFGRRSTLRVLDSLGLCRDTDTRCAVITPAGRALAEAIAKDGAK